MQVAWDVSDHAAAVWLARAPRAEKGATRCQRPGMENPTPPSKSSNASYNRDSPLSLRCERRCLGDRGRKVVARDERGLCPGCLAARLTPPGVVDSSA